MKYTWHKEPYLSIYELSFTSITNRTILLFYLHNLVFIIYIVLVRLSQSASLLTPSDGAKV